MESVCSRQHKNRPTLLLFFLCGIHFLLVILVSLSIESLYVHIVSFLVIVVILVTLTVVRGREIGFPSDRGGVRGEREERAGKVREKRAEEER